MSPQLPLGQDGQPQPLPINILIKQQEVSRHDQTATNPSTLSRNTRTPKHAVRAGKSAMVRSNESITHAEERPNVSPMAIIKSLRDTTKDRGGKSIPLKSMTPIERILS